eukprot:jgi/Tetstr1/442303/TSEL_030444.t1
MPVAAVPGPVVDGVQTVRVYCGVRHGAMPSAVATTPLKLTKEGVVVKAGGAGSGKEAAGDEGQKATPTRRALSVLYYMLSSVLVQSSNKALFTNWGFQFPLLIALLQMSIIAPVCYAISRPKLSFNHVLKLLPLAMVNVCNVVLGLLGTAGLTVPMFIALRRFTLVTTIICEYVLYRKVHDWQTLLAVGIMVTGGLIAALNDLNFKLLGYLAVLGNDVATSLYLVLMKNISHDLTATGLLFYNSFLSLPLLCGAVALAYPDQGWREYEYSSYPAFQVVLISSCCLGLTINHSTFVCTRMNDPLTVHVAGNFKNILMTLLGAVAFGDFVFHHWLVVGLSISVSGSCYYAWLKVSGMMAQRSRAPKAASNPV